jgi:hypothetical protein
MLVSPLPEPAMRVPVLAATLVALLSLPVAAAAQSDDEIREYNYRKAREEAAERYAQTEANRKEVEAIRAKVLKQPPLPAAKNPLLGRWVMLTKPPGTENLMDLMVNAESHMETLMCSMFFGDEEFEYRPDALVLADAGGDIVADGIAYRAGKNGAVFALGDRLIRLLVFEFDVGPDRARSGRCVYAKVKPKRSNAPATPLAGKPAAQAAAPAPTRAPPARAYPGTGMKVAGATLGVDHPGAIDAVIKARGGTVLVSLTEGVGPLRFYGRDADYRDVAPDVFSVAYDFDEDGPGGQLIAVTLIYVGGSSESFNARAAALSAQHGLPTPSSPVRQEGTVGHVRVTHAVDAASGTVMETWRVK